MSGFIHASQGRALWRVMAVSALAEKRGRQAYRARMSRYAAGLLQSADAIAMSFISVAVFISCKFLEIFTIYRSYYVAEGRRMNCILAPTVYRW